MKKTLLSLIALLITAIAFAYDAEIDGICYNLNNENKTADVTYQCYWSSDNYSGITTLTIPSSVTYNSETYNVTSIGNGAFTYCSSLSSIKIPNSGTSIGYQAFSYCSSLTSITIPNSITSISDYTFEYCSSLTSITIPNSVTSIGYGAFESCSSLTFISLPDSLKSIGDFAFSNCINIDTIKVDAIIPPTITATSFNNVSRDIEFIVPEEAREAYAEHEYWKEFIQKAPSNVENNESVNTEIFTQNGTLHIDGITTDYQIYNTSGQLVYSGNASTLSLPRGIYLVTINGETQKIVL